jgi:hypothetical protein
MEGSEWVGMRASCTAFESFKRLTKEVQSDVEAMNTVQRAQGQNREFAMKIHSDKTFSVFLTGNFGPILRGVDFGVDVHSGIISVRGANPAVDIDATVALGDKGKCKLKVKDVELKFWQFRRRALEALFFGF